MVSSVEHVLFLDPLIKCYGKMRSDEDELCANLIRLSFPDHGFRFTVHYFEIIRCNDVSISRKGNIIQPFNATQTCHFTLAGTLCVLTISQY